MSLYELLDPNPASPAVLVVGLEGWIDAGLGAITALTSLTESITTTPVAIFDADELLDHRSRRPVVTVDNGFTSGISWPEIELRSGLDRAGNPMLFLLGPEPDLHWRAFGKQVADLAVQLGVRLAVGLGAFPAPAPHTRPVRVAATSPDQALAGRVGVVAGTVKVPAGVEAVLELAFEQVRIPAVGLWARVPHYVEGMPYPAASAALVDTLARVGELDLDSSTLHRAADLARQRVDELIAESDDLKAMLQQLEQHLDSAEGNTMDLGEVPSGEDIAAELERYLRGEG